MMFFTWSTFTNLNVFFYTFMLLLIENIIYVCVCEYTLYLPCEQSYFYYGFQLENTIIIKYRFNNFVHKLKSIIRIYLYAVYIIFCPIKVQVF